MLFSLLKFINHSNHTSKINFNKLIKLINLNCIIFRFQQHKSWIKNTFINFSRKNITSDIFSFHTLAWNFLLLQIQFCIFRKHFPIFMLKRVVISCRNISMLKKLPLENARLFFYMKSLRIYLHIRKYKKKMILYLLTYAIYLFNLATKYTYLHLNIPLCVFIQNSMWNLKNKSSLCNRFLLFFMEIISLISIFHFDSGRKLSSTFFQKFYSFLHFSSL